MLFLQATARNSGPAAAALREWQAGTFTLYVSQPVLDEVRDVLARPKVRAKNPLLTDARVEALLQGLERRATLLTEVPPHFTYPRDPKDEKYVNLAVAAGANYLVSRDKDLLDLMEEGRPEGLEFRARFPSLTILDPVSFLRVLSPQPELEVTAASVSQASSLTRPAPEPPIPQTLPLDLDLELEQ